MNADKNIQNEVDKTLNSLDNWQMVNADAFFYTRLSAKLEKKTQASTAFNWLFNTPILKPALVAAALIINITSILYLSYQSTSETDFTEAFTSEYMLDQSTESYLVLNE